MSRKRDKGDGHSPFWRGPLLAWGALLLLLAVNVALAYLLGGDNPLIGVGIAVAMVLVVAIIFMDLRRSGPINRSLAGAGLVWLGIMFALMFADYLTRS